MVIVKIAVRSTVRVAVIVVLATEVAVTVTLVFVERMSGAA